MKPLVFVSADIDGLESRTMAQCCLNLVGQSELARVLNEGQDSHLIMAANMLGLSYDEAVAGHAEEKRRRGDGEKIATPVDDARQAGKVANFGFPGGLGAEKLVLFARKTYKVNLTIDGAKALKRTWLRTFPEFKLYFEYFGKLAESGPAAVFKSFYSGRLRAGMHYASLCNNPFQSLGADATGNVLFLLSEACYTETACRACQGRREMPAERRGMGECPWCRGSGVSSLFGCRLVNYVHDDFMLEARENIAHEVAYELLRIIEEGMSPYLPDVPATAKPIVSRFWSKDAKQIWIDDAGAPSVKGKEAKRLVAWPKAA